MNLERLKKQIDFVTEVDKLKQIYRQTILLDRSRNENDAEHTWHMALAAIVLAEHADEANLDMLRTLKMIMVHDLVEIDAGDTFAYDDQGYLDKAEREQRAAARIFGLLPDGQGDELRALWDEFEESSSPEAKFANAVDTLMPMLHNCITEGQQWQKRGVTSDKVLARNQRVKDGSSVLGSYLEQLIHDAVNKGHLGR